MYWYGSKFLLNSDPNEKFKAFFQGCRSRKIPALLKEGFCFMKVINATLNNSFRHPLRWGKCPVNLGEDRVYGFIASWGEKMPASLTNRWTVVLYFYKWFWAISNYNIRL